MRSSATRCRSTAAWLPAAEWANALVLVTTHAPRLTYELLPANATPQQKADELARLTATDVLPFWRPAAATARAAGGRDRLLSAAGQQLADARDHDDHRRRPGHADAQGPLLRRRHRRRVHVAQVGGACDLTAAVPDPRQRTHRLSAAVRDRPAQVRFRRQRCRVPRFGRSRRPSGLGSCAQALSHQRARQRRPARAHLHRRHRVGIANRCRHLRCATALTRHADRAARSDPASAC